MKRILCIFFLFVFHLATTGQLIPVYTFQKDDSVLKEKYYQEALEKKTSLVNSLSKEDKDYYKKIYENRFEQVSSVLKSNRTITEAESHQYLQALVSRITDANDELKQLDKRVLFSRDWWPNAYSMGEGTIMFNAGLMIYLENEAEFVFVLCHELAHYYLDHGNKAIKKSVERANSDEIKAELKKLAKLEYRVGQRFEKLLRSLIYDSRQHSRENETEADRYAFMFMKKTGFATSAITSCLQILDKIDDSMLHKPLQLEHVFNFTEYPFKKKWIQNESVLFGEMKEDESPLSKKEKDSLKTHPDCIKRIGLLMDSIQMIGAQPGQSFLVNEKLFKQLKKDLFVEMTEQNFRDKNLGRNLYYNLVMLQQGENIPLAIYSIARGLNVAYESQKNHTLGLWFYPETRGLPSDYNLLLRMLSRLKLEEVAALGYHFCKQYQAQMRGYVGFDEEMSKAQKRMN